MTLLEAKIAMGQAKEAEKNHKYTRHEHRQSPANFFLKLWTFAPLFSYSDLEILGHFGVSVDF